MSVSVSVSVSVSWNSSFTPHGLECASGSVRSPDRSAELQQLLIMLINLRKLWLAAAVGTAAWEAIEGALQLAR